MRLYRHRIVGGEGSTEGSPEKKQMPNGLANSRNTCYVNTTLQCLLHSQFIPRALLAQHPNDVMTSPLLRTLLDTFAQLLNSSPASVVNPHGLLEVLKVTLAPLMNIYEQNDMQEFLIILLERMVDAIAKITPAPAAPPLPTKDADADADADAKKHWHACLKPDFSLMKEAIYGQSITHITCGHCGKDHFAYDIFTTLMLPVRDETSNVRDCMNAYAARETLAPSEWKCDACGTRSDGNTRSLRFSRLPHVLILCLNRSRETMRKNNAVVELPPELAVVGGAQTRVYRLSSVACHSGNAMSGHYYALCRHFDHAWYRIDDAMVFPLAPPTHDLPKAASSDAYVVFYTMH